MPRLPRSPRAKKLFLELLEDRTLLDSGLGIIPGLTDTEPNRFATGLYFDFLHRMPDPTEVVPWVSALGGGMPRAAMAAQFTHSPEYFNNLIVEDYGRLLARPASGGDISSWTHALFTGTRPDDISAAILASGEYYALHGNTPTGFVASIFQDVLGRAVDSGSLTSWVNALQGGMTRFQEAQSILASGEASVRVITADYQLLLGRQPDPAGLAWGQSALGTETNLDFQAQITASTEFSNFQVTHDLQGPAAPAVSAAHYDFGPTGSPVASGYTGVGVTPYSPVLGYGWEQMKGLGAYDRGTADPLTRDFVAVPTNTFVVNVTNGAYLITVTLGDAFAAHTNMAIYAEGSLAASGLTSQAKQFLHPSFTAVVTKGQLALRFTGDSSRFALDGLDIVSFTPTQPTANAGPNQTVNELTPVSFAGSEAGGIGPYVYSWSFGDGTTASGTLTPTHTYSAPGNYTAVLAVTDGIGHQSAAFASINVNDVQPVLNANGDYAGTVNAPIAFHGSAVLPPDVNRSSFTYSWDFGDSTTSTGLTPTHTYANPGTFAVRLIAIEPDGNTCFTTAVVTVSPATLNQVTMDSNWLAQHGPPPYLLTQPNTVYTLATDVDVAGTAFINGAANVTLNLNGHTVTYDDAAPITVPNALFQTGDLTGWTFSDPSVASVVPAITGMNQWGSNCLVLTNISTAETFTSQPISIPAANWEYAATITPRCNDYRTAITLSVIDTVTHAVLGSATASQPHRGFSPIAQFTPTATDPVYLQISVTPYTGATDTVYFDYAAVYRSRDWGIVNMVASWTGFFPAQLQSPAIQGVTANARNFTIENGTVTQGIGRGYSSIALYTNSLNGLAVTNVTVQATGVDTPLLYTQGDSNVVVRNSTFAAGLDRISSRFLQLPIVSFYGTTGAVTLENSTILGSSQVGVFISRTPGATAPVNILNNTIDETGLVTDCYGISIFDNTQNFTIAGNTINPPTNGRGLFFDLNDGTTISGGLVENNTIEAREAGNLEYPSIGMEATALRIKNPGNTSAIRDITFRNNLFFAETGIGLDWACTAMRLTLYNVSGQMTNCGLVFENNVFRARLDTIDPSYTSPRNPRAWGASIDQLPPGSGVSFLNNTFESNDVMLNLGDNDGWLETIDGTGSSFVGNTFAYLNQGAAQTPRSVVVGDWEETVHNVQLIDNHFINGATNQIYFPSNNSNDLEIGSLLNVVVIGSSGNFIANASVQVLNSGNTQLYSGTTNGGGSSGNVPLVTTTYTQVNGSPPQVSQSGSFTLVAALGTLTTSQPVTLTGDLVSILTIPGV
jgi:PKD repeat protein